MAFLEVPSDFLAFLAKQHFDDAQAEDVGRKLVAYEIFSPKELLVFFSAGPSIYDFWKDHLDWERKGGILSKLKDMLIKLQNHEKRRPSRNQTGSWIRVSTTQFTKRQTRPLPLLG